jgi:inorganic pyrophosphatase
MGAPDGCGGNTSLSRLRTNRARHAILSDTATFELRVVIETPKGSRNKYDYAPECDCMELGAVLPEGMTFPFDFGFVPSTLGEDGDPLDILVLIDGPVVPGCVIRARLVVTGPRLVVRFEC